MTNEDFLLIVVDFAILAMIIAPIVYTAKRIRRKIRDKKREKAWKASAAREAENSDNE